MKTIYKYTINTNGSEVDMPEGAKILTVREQNNEICLWACVDTDKPLEPRHFEVYGTGHMLPKDMRDRKYIGTAFVYNDTIVFHVFEYFK
jgi:hypothetical protein